MKRCVVGFDTSNYTTSVALFDGEDGRNVGRLLEVPQGGLGLRQSDALFQHVKRLPELMEQLCGQEDLRCVAAVGVSARPRAVEGSYMPCFLAGVSQARCLGAALGVPVFSCSHQQGHLAAAAWSAGCMEVLEKPFLAWHLSGGTTELLYVKPGEQGLSAEIIGGTQDISAGQLIDRTGVALGLSFPAGKALDAMCTQSNSKAKPFKVKLQGFYFSLSGMENKVKTMVQDACEPEDVAHFAVDTVVDTVVRVTRLAQEQYPGLPVLCSGGVASNSRLRQALTDQCRAHFALPQYSTDNAMGVAVLTHQALQRGELG
ncbi:MAG: DNA-binding protein [Oscillospiraceae bacterium]|nr:DNA-binding protein [Oscillospiraceae bacterium]